MKKVFIPVIAAAVMLAGCEKKIPEVTEQTSETEAYVTEITAASVSESTTKEVEEAYTETSAETEAETSADAADTAENERSEFVIKAEENPAVNVDIIIDERDIYNLSETPVGYFYADYPEISGADEAVCKKINEAVKTYVDGVLQELQEYVYNFGNVDDRNPQSMYSFWINDLGRKEIRSVGCEINCNYGNLLSIYFRAFTYNIVVPI
ncbi:MAG: hypothetical protein K2N71_12080, partial [Oscillospiraceae bacterium]|nr:hypothetical protein [Oscillospiraceae bacterium]